MTTTGIPMRSAPRVGAVLAIFVLSGAAGLMYEIVWSRQLVLVFGNTTQAVSAILTGFFGGMAIGAAVGGRIADRVRSPLRLYGLLECVLVVVVLVTPISFGLIREVYRGIYPSLEGSPTLLAVVRLILAVAALAPATVLMGATFPSLTRYLARTSALSRAFGRLYAANTMGAIVGTLAAGLVLIELLGLSGALEVGAGCSLVAGLTALWLARGRDVDRSAGDGLPDTTADIPSVSVSAAAATPPDQRADPVQAGVIPRPRLALAVAFFSGLTSLAYQVTWTRLLASGTGNTTYVFTVILATFLIGIALGALIFSSIRPRLKNPLRLLAASQILVAAFASLGLIVLVSPHALDPLSPFTTIRSLLGSAMIVVLPATVVLGVAFPAASMLLRDRAASAGGESGQLLAVNTTGAIVGSLVIPFVLMPTIGSPMIVAVLALSNLCLGVILAVVAQPRSRPAILGGAVVAVMLVTIVTRPGLVVQPNEALILAKGGTVFASTEDEIASVQSGQVGLTPELWVAGTSMTLLTVDAKLMPILPLIARPQSSRALVVAFGMGTAFRGALIAGLKADVVELVPSVPDMFGFYYDDAATVLADPNGRVIVADGRNHLELSTEHFDIILTDPPPPIESSGASVISSFEYYQAGKAHLTPGGIMMQWVPYGAPESEFKEHLRTFAAVYPHVTVIKGAGGYGAYVLGSEQPMTFTPEAIREVLSRPGVLEDISSAYDSPAKTVDDWIEVLADQHWLDDAEVTAYAGDGPLITDDHPRPEYFLLRRLANGTANR